MNEQAPTQESDASIAHRQEILDKLRGLDPVGRLVYMAKNFEEVDRALDPDMPFTKEQHAVARKRRNAQLPSGRW